MFFTHLKITFRNLLKTPVISLINILSLTIGMVCCILILLFIKQMLSFDRFHENGESIYRVAMESVNVEGSIKTASTTAAVGPCMQEELPGVEMFTRFRAPQAGYFYYGGKSIFDHSIVYVDSSLFDIFSFRLLRGNPATVLRDPYSIVLTEEMAFRIFGTEDPVGKQLMYNKENHMVTGIVESPPLNSHIRFSSLISFSTLYKDSRLHLGWNGGWQYYTYIRFSDPSAPGSLEPLIPDFMYRHINHLYEKAGGKLIPIFQPLHRIYLHSGTADSFGPAGNLAQLYIFSAIGLFILAIACINFMNLSTARSLMRAKEVGIRKVVGANRTALIRQFLGESVFLSLIGFIIAVLVIEIILPRFNAMTGIQLRLYVVSNWKLIISVPFIILFVGLLAGSYPSVYLSSFNPVKILKGTLLSSSGKPVIRNLLVVLQFIISVVLIISTVIIFQQIRFMKHSELGFDRENLLILPLADNSAREKHEVLKAAFLQLPGVKECSVSSDYPGHGFTSNGYVPEGFREYLMFNVIDVDYDFAVTYGLQITGGRFFSPDHPSDRDAYVVNEALARHLNWTDPVGKKIFRNEDHEVIGVIKDFNFASLHSDIAPLIFTIKPDIGYHYISLRLFPVNSPPIMAEIQRKWEEILPGIVFDYLFLEEEFDNIYRSELRFGRAILSFALLAIVIACMGLFGLASHVANQKTKEIGIRKVMGASTVRLLAHLSGEFGKWVFIASIFAWPAALLLATKWLQNFSFRIDISPWVFILTTLAVIVLAYLTIGLQTLKAANTQPARTLKYE